MFSMRIENKLDDKASQSSMTEIFAVDHRAGMHFYAFKAKLDMYPLFFSLERLNKIAVYFVLLATQYSSRGVFAFWKQLFFSMKD